MKRAAVALLAALALAGPARAVLPGEQLADPRLEARARHIGGELRCLVCQNQSIDDSDAPLAGDLRVILLLWLGPGLVLVAGGVWVALMARGRGGVIAPAAPLTAEEREQLARRLEAESAS
jgi:cytochrome c-type biogenesis protein CcmH